MRSFIPRDSEPFPVEILCVDENVKRDGFTYNLSGRCRSVPIRHVSEQREVSKQTSRGYLSVSDAVPEQRSQLSPDEVPEQPKPRPEI
jgi:hypothetical protein